VEISNDAASCFDRMIEACQNLSCRQHGADSDYLKLRAQTIQMLQYHVKHAFGILEDYNDHTAEHPWYGAGQGAGDAAPRWVILANSLILAYVSQALPWILNSPDHSLKITQGFDAFMDDTTITNVATATETLQATVTAAQQNLNLWNDLLQASGGMLNPAKCVWFLFNWEFRPNGDVKLHHPQNQTITVTNPPHAPQPIKRLKPNEAHRYLGVHLTTDGNYTKELKVFQEQNARYINLLRCSPFTRREVRTVYLQCYLPTTSYPLPATNIPSSILHNAQKSYHSLSRQVGIPKNLRESSDICYSSTRRIRLQTSRP